LFVACGPQKTPDEHDVHFVADRPPAEKVPGAHGLGAAPLPGHATPAGHGAAFDVVSGGQ
jgi:hypothetical protein